MARGRFDVPIQLGDSITISSTLVSTSGPIGSQGSAVLQPNSQFPSSTITANGSDSVGSSGQGSLLSFDGQIYGTPGESVSTPATVTALSGVGSVALVTAVLRSGLLVQVQANACFCANQGGNSAGAL
jgi:hypothetical protein